MDLTTELARDARNAGDLVAAAMTVSTAAKYVEVAPQHAASLEVVVNALLDDATDELADRVFVHGGESSMARAQVLAADFLVAWGRAAAEIPAAVLAGDAAALADLEARRSALLAQLVVDAG